ncbi:hypothetical protein [Rheinheimera pacifica]|uniref:hypothetical protein n=1 Tax=Rheinheimera pacifica TaxID=173990 RepID=UPI002ED87C73
MKKYCLILFWVVLPVNSWAAVFTNYINEVQVYQDRVRVHIGGGHGTCGEKEGWFGWSTSNELHKDWFSLVLMAKAANVKISMYDQNDSCAGPAGAIGIEGVFLPKTE